MHRTLEASFTELQHHIERGIHHKLGGRLGEYWRPINNGLQTAKDTMVNGKFEERHMCQDTRATINSRQDKGNNQRNPPPAPR